MPSSWGSVTTHVFPKHVAALEAQIIREWEMRAKIHSTAGAARRGIMRPTYGERSTKSRAESEKYHAVRDLTVGRKKGVRVSVTVGDSTNGKAEETHKGYLRAYAAGVGDVNLSSLVIMHRCNSRFGKPIDYDKIVDIRLSSRRNQRGPFTLWQHITFHHTEQEFLAKGGYQIVQALKAASRASKKK